MELKDALKVTINRNGKEILSDANMLKAYLSDLAPEHGKDIQIITDTSRHHYLDGIARCDDSNLPGAVEEFRKSATALFAVPVVEKIEGLLIYALDLNPGKQNVKAGSNTEKEKKVQEGPAFSVQDGVLISYNGTSSSVWIPPEVRSISAKAFKYNYDIQEVIIPEGITIIKANTFLNCRKLKRVGLPSTLETIGANAFKGCIMLEDIVLPASVRTIRNDAFRDTERLNYSRLFRNCAIADVSLDIADSDLENKYQKLRERYNPVQETKSETVTREVPEFYIQDGVLTAYSGASPSVLIPSEVKSISARAFRDSPDIEQVVIPEGITVIKANTFLSCKKLRRVVLPSTLETIEANAFNGCRNLEDIVLPLSVKTIRKDAFRDTGKLDYYKLFRNCAGADVSLDIADSDLAAEYQKYRPVKTKISAEKVTASAGGFTASQGKFTKTSGKVIQPAGKLSFSKPDVITVMLLAAALVFNILYAEIFTSDFSYIKDLIGDLWYVIGGGMALMGILILLKKYEGAVAAWIFTVIFNGVPFLDLIEYSEIRTTMLGLILFNVSGAVFLLMTVLGKTKHWYLPGIFTLLSSLMVLPLHQLFDWSMNGSWTKFISLLIAVVCMSAAMFIFGHTLNENNIVMGKLPDNKPAEERKVSKSDVITAVLIVAALLFNFSYVVLFFSESYIWYLIEGGMAVMSILILLKKYKGAVAAWIFTVILNFLPFMDLIEYADIRTAMLGLILFSVSGAVFLLMTVLGKTRHWYLAGIFTLLSSLMVLPLHPIIRLSSYIIGLSTETASPLLIATVCLSAAMFIFGYSLNENNKRTGKLSANKTVNRNK